VVQPVLALPQAEPITLAKKVKVPVEQNKYYNKALVERLRLLDDQRENVKKELEGVQANIDREVFYELLLDWDYGGIKPYDT
jgi:hypothetical protein